MHPMPASWDCCIGAQQADIEEGVVACSAMRPPPAAPNRATALLPPQRLRPSDAAALIGP